MVWEKIFEQNENLIESDKNHAQILIEIGSDINIIEKAKQIIEGLGINVVDTKNISPQWVLLKLDVKDMREIVLKLTESGFLNIEGYNASSFEI
jgi:hypothetical protein